MKSSELRGLLKAFSLVSQLGLTVAVAIGLGAGLGIVLQRTLGLGALGFLFGLASGLGGAFLGARSLLEEVLQIPFEPGPKGTSNFLEVHERERTDSPDAEAREKDRP